MTSEKELALALAGAQSENAVTDLIEHHPLLHNARWKTYGGRQFAGTVFNQQQKPVAASTDIIVNSIDHVLLRECRLRGIDPESPQAPRNMADAVERFFGIREGDFSEVITKNAES
ncbi:MAG: hypothetical protein NZ951_04975 [Dehalococcoidia bacterium]|nr:hypothetical protein [Dehalococcoidia bacterium]MDW8120648.1 hypothetical protein [Chloroflexota bacterium]